MPERPLLCRIHVPNPYPVSPTTHPGATGCALRRAVLSVTLLATLALTAPVVASRPPTDRERAGVAAAMDEIGFNCSKYPPGHCRLKVRISTVNASYARANLLPRRGHEDTVQPEAASAVRKRHRWKVLGVRDGAGCDMPRRVRRDLRLDCFE